MPRLRSSAQTPAQNFAPSDAWTQIPNTCLIDAIQIDTDGDMRGPVLDLVAIADLHHQGVAVDDRVELLQRRDCHSVTSSSTASVMLAIVSWDSSVPIVRSRCA